MWQRLICRGAACSGERRWACVCVCVCVSHSCSERRKESAEEAAERILGRGVCVCVFTSVCVCVCLCVCVCACVSSRPSGIIGSRPAFLPEWLLPTSRSVLASIRTLAFPRQRDRSSARPLAAPVEMGLCGPWRPPEMCSSTLPSNRSMTQSYQSATARLREAERKEGGEEGGRPEQHASRSPGES